MKHHVNLSVDNEDSCTQSENELIYVLFNLKIINPSNIVQIIKYLRQYKKYDLIISFCIYAKRYINNDYVNIAIAEAYYSKRNFATAVRYFRYVEIENNKVDFNVILRMLRCYLNMFDYSNARECLNRLKNWNNSISEHQSITFNDVSTLIETEQAKIFDITFNKCLGGFLEISSTNISSKAYLLQNYLLTFKLKKVFNNIELCIEYKTSCKESTHEYIPVTSLMPNEQGEYSLKLDLLTINKISIYDSLKEEVIDTYELISKENINNQILRGKDNWLFLSNDGNKSVEQYEGKLLINDENLHSWEDFLRTASKIKNCVFCIPPSKESVYSSYYPYKQADIRPINQLLLKLRQSKILYNYPIELLNKINDSYSKTDTHWNQHASWMVLKLILGMIGLNNLDYIDNALCFKEVTLLGDLGSKLTPKEYSSRITLNPECSLYQGECIFQNHGVFHQGSINIYLNEESLYNKTICVFGDSFSINWIPFLRYMFRKSIIVRSNASIISSILTHEKPDYVILENTERFILRAPKIYQDIIDYTPCLRLDYPDIIPWVSSYFKKNNSSDIYGLYMKKYYEMIK